MKRSVLILLCILSAQIVFSQSYWQRAEKFSFSILGGGTNLFHSEDRDLGVFGVSMCAYNLYFDFLHQPSRVEGVKTNTDTWHVGYRFETHGLGLTPICGLSDYRSLNVYETRKTNNRIDYGFALDHSFQFTSTPKLRASIGISRYNLYAGIGVRF